MDLFSWFKSEPKKPHDDWEWIGSNNPSGRGKFKSVPNWVQSAYGKVHVHHHGLIYYFNGRHFRYKFVESGQGGGYCDVYRKHI